MNDLCRREGTKPRSYYAWTKKFMESGKKRLTCDSVRDATRQEIQVLKNENDGLKQLVAELSLEVYRLKKNGHPDATRHCRYQRMSATEKAEVLTKVASLLSPNVWSSESGASPRAPTTGGSDNRGWMTGQETAQHHGTA